MSNTKIKLEICCGTTCYMLGSAELLKIEEVLPEAWLEEVAIRAIPCMGMCTSGNISNAPIARLNGKVINRASFEVILEELRLLIESRA